MPQVEEALAVLAMRRKRKCIATSAGRPSMSRGILGPAAASVIGRHLKSQHSTHCAFCSLVDRSPPLPTRRFILMVACKLLELTIMYKVVPVYKVLLTLLFDFENGHMASCEAASL